jgi:hypothetical protein
MWVDESKASPFCLVLFFVPPSRCGKRIHESDGFKHKNQKCDFLKRIRISSFGCFSKARVIAKRLHSKNRQKNFRKLNMLILFVFGICRKPLWNLSRPRSSVWYLSRFQSFMFAFCPVLGGYLSLACLGFVTKEHSILLSFN